MSHLSANFLFVDCFSLFLFFLLFPLYLSYPSSPVRGVLLLTTPAAQQVSEGIRISISFMDKKSYLQGRISSREGYEDEDLDLHCNQQQQQALEIGSYVHGEEYNVIAGAGYNIRESFGNYGNDNYSNVQYPRATLEYPSLSGEDFPPISTSPASTRDVEEAGSIAMREEIEIAPVTHACWGAQASSSATPWVDMARLDQHQQRFQPSTMFQMHSLRGGRSGGSGGTSRGSGGTSGRDSTYMSTPNLNRGRGGRYKGGKGGQRQHSPSQPQHMPSSSEPLVITIGSVCSGKTTYLKNQPNDRCAQLIHSGKSISNRPKT